MSQDPWREHPRGGYPSPAAVALPGREQLQRLLDGRTPEPPISRLMGLRLTSASDRNAVFEMSLTNWLQAADGEIPIGALVIPADAAAACALQSVLPAATPFSTSELTIRMLARPRLGRTLRAHGRLIQIGHPLGLAEATLTDDEQRLLAHASTLCMMSAAAEPPAPGADHEKREPAPDGDDPDPWERPARGATLPRADRDRLSGLELLRGQLSGGLPASPLRHLTGLTASSVAPGEATFAMPAGEWLCAPAPGRVQGGAIALLADAALTASVQTRLSPGTTAATVDLKINYLRPLAADGRWVLAHGKLLHLGRRIAVARAEVRDADHRPVALATGSAMVDPGER